MAILGVDDFKSKLTGGGARANLFKATVSVSGWKQFFTNKTVPKYFKTLSSYSNQLKTLLSNE